MQKSSDDGMTRWMASLRPPTAEELNAIQGPDPETVESILKLASVCRAAPLWASLKTVVVGFVAPFGAFAGRLKEGVFVPFQGTKGNPGRGQLSLSFGYGWGASAPVRGTKPGKRACSGLTANTEEGLEVVFRRDPVGGGREDIRVSVRQLTPDSPPPETLAASAFTGEADQEEMVTSPASLLPDENAPGYWQATLENLPEGAIIALIRRGQATGGEDK